MTQAPPFTVAAGRGRNVRRLVLAGCAAVTALAAAGVLLSGVIVTSGVYGSRMAWLLGVVLPLLGLTALLAWLASSSETSPADEGPAGRLASNGHLRNFAKVALALIAVPFVLAAMVLLVYAVAIAAHGVAGLLR